MEKGWPGPQGSRAPTDQEGKGFSLEPSWNEKTNAGLKALLFPGLFAF